ncbi:MAG: peptidoglycan DD-metalloendopeptidase family protein [Anaerolineae bacterium]
MPTHPLRLQQALAQSPTPFIVSPYYGVETISQGYSTSHPAIDFDSVDYEPVLAAAGGTVDLVKWENDTCRTCGYGFHIRINHGNNYRTLYAHMSTLVSVGTQVRRGQIIGTSGNSGNSSGPHLHFEVEHFVNNMWVKVNPSNENGVPLWIDGWINDSTPGVNPGRPFPVLRTSGEIIIDDTTNNSGGFQKGTGSQVFSNPCTGNCSDWNDSSTGGYNGHRYWNPVTNTSTAANWAAWVPNIGTNNEGWYEVEAYIPASNATTWQATYQIRHNGGQTPVTVDQAGLNNIWVSLGVYQLTLISGAYVSVTDATGNEGSPNNHCGVGGTCQVGVDAVRFRRLATYLPDIRSASSGWDSAFYIRNDGAGPTDVRISVLNQSGVSVESFTYTNLAVHGRLYYNPVITSLDGAVAVDSPQPVSVAVTQQNLSPFRSAAYTGVNQPATEAHIPLLHKNNGAWTSDIFIQNTLSASSNITVEFKVAAIFGQGTDCTQNYTFAAYGTRKIDLGSLTCVGSSFLGGARITSTQPVAVATTERTGSLLMETSNAVGPAIGTGYLPLVQNEGGTGWTSGLSLQNVSNNTQTLSASYYVRSGAACGSANYPNVGAYRPYIVNPFPPSCPDIIEGATLSGPDRATSHVTINSGPPTAMLPPTAIATPGKTVYFPFWLKQSGWVPGLAVYNPNNQSASVTVRYYNADGSLNSSPPSQATVAAHGVAIFYNTPSAASFSGSAVVTSNQPVAAVLNHSSSSSGGDGLMTYEGMHY